MSRRRTTFLSIAAAVAAMATTGPVAVATADELVATVDVALFASGSCAPLNPCTLQDAAGRARSGDTIVLQSGRHELSAPLVLAEGVSIVGEAGKTHAELGSATGLAGPTLTVKRGTVRHLQVSATGTGQPAIRLRDSGAVVDTAAASLTGPAVTVEADDDLVLLRDSAFVSRSANAGVATLKVEGKKTVAIRNLTVWAAFGAGGIRCDDDEGAVTILNTLARGIAYDVKGDRAACAVRHSAVRPEKLEGVGNGTGNVGVDPQVHDPASQNFRPASGSPLIDAGTADPLLGQHDLDGRARTLGTAVDIGAYESTESRPASQPDPGTDPVAEEPGKGPDDKGKEDKGKDDKDKQPKPAPAPPPPPPAPAPPAPAAPAGDPAPADPALGKSITLDAEKGKVKVKLPGSGRYVALEDAKTLPVGTVVDATSGTVTLTSELPGGSTQSGTFSGGAFQVRQPKDAKGMTDILLTGGSFDACGEKAKAKAVTARAASAKKKKGRKAVRRLWASDEGGRFRTHGAESVTTVRGTSWLTEDRCDGTYTKVNAGAVDVRAKRTGRVTRVKAGHDLLVRRTGTR